MLNTSIEIILNATTIYITEKYFQIVVNVVWNGTNNCLLLACIATEYWKINELVTLCETNVMQFKRTLLINYIEIDRNNKVFGPSFIQKLVYNIYWTEYSVWIRSEWKQTDTNSQWWTNPNERRRCFKQQIQIHTSKTLRIL